MGLGVNGEGNVGFMPDIGLHNVVCCGVVDVGTRQDQKYNKKKHDVIIRFVFPEITQMGDDGEYHPTLGQFYTLSIAPNSNLGKHLTLWRGKEFTDEERKRFELKTILGIPATITVGRTQNGRACVESISKPMKKHSLPEGELEFFSFEEFDGTFPDFMSENMKNFMKTSDEYQEYLHHVSGGADAQAAEEEVPASPEEFDGDIPF